MRQLVHRSDLRDAPFIAIAGLCVGCAASLLLAALA